MAQTSASKSDPQKDLPQEMIETAYETGRPPFEPESARLYQRLAYISVIGVFVVLLSCICACAAIAAAFLLNAPW